MIVAKTMLFFLAALTFGEASQYSADLIKLNLIVNVIKRHADMQHNEIKTLLQEMTNKMTTQDELVLSKLAEITTQINDRCSTLPDSGSDKCPPRPKSPLAHQNPGSGLDLIPYGNISFSSNDPSSYKNYVDLLNEFIEPYEEVRDHGGNANIIECTGQVLESEQVCRFNVDWLRSPCARPDTWGFSESRPCVLMTYHNDPAFEPEVYTSMDDLPCDVPDDLKNNIKLVVEEYHVPLAKMVWVHCTNAASYDPGRVFPYYFFPNKDLDYYMPPIIGVVFDLRSRDTLEVECSQWDITSDRAERKIISFTITKTP